MSANTELAAQQESDAGPRLRAPSGSEEDGAIEFARRFSDQFKFTPLLGGWQAYEGGRFVRDNDMLRHMTAARRITLELASEEATDNAARRAASDKMKAAIISLARCDPRIVVPSDAWDADDWALNTPAGVVNLKTGELRAHARGDLFRKITSIAPDGSCDVWRQALDDWMGGDQELVGFLKRFAGYSLTGCVAEHVMLFLYGTGGNGKSTFIETLYGVLGDYAKTTAIETFTASPTDRHPTELAGLMGKRLVVASETEPGRYWAESRLKKITGGETITARFMRGDEFEFLPKLKLVISGNNKPRLKSTDEAIRRRLCLIPLDVTIAPEKKDKFLNEKLRAEWPGILRWAIEGCLEWQRDGLKIPDRVRAATADYLTDEDKWGQWIEDCVELRPGDPSSWELAEHLRASWFAWADGHNEQRGTRQELSEALQRRGAQPCRKGARSDRAYTCVRLPHVDAVGDPSEREEREEAPQRELGIEREPGCDDGDDRDGRWETPYRSSDMRRRRARPQNRRQLALPLRPVAPQRVFAFAA